MMEHQKPVHRLPPGLLVFLFQFITTIVRQIIRIPSKLYRHLYELKDDRLIAVFCMLKAVNREHGKIKAYVSKNGKAVAGYGLLRKQAGISLATLQKYLPYLIKAGLVNFEANGDVTIIGNEKAKELYSSYKLVPIAIDKNLSETAVNSYLVRVNSNIRQQDRSIIKKQFRSDLLKHLDNPGNIDLYKAAKRVERRYGKDLGPISETRLSNTGFSNLKHLTKTIFNTKSTGQYWKARLEQKGLILVERSFHIVAPITYYNFVSMKQHGNLNNHEVYHNGFLCREGINKVSVNPV